MKQKHFWCLSVGVQGDPNMKMTQVVVVRCFWWGGGEGRANLQLSMSRGSYKLLTSIRVVVMSFKEWSQKLLVKAFFFFCIRTGTVYMYLWRVKMNGIPAKMRFWYKFLGVFVKITMNSPIIFKVGLPLRLKSVSIPHKVALHGT